MLVLIGESASGKSTLQDLINKEFNHIKVVTYTTRPIRAGEEDGVSYHYISDEEFKQLEKQDFFVETAEYNGWHYGTPLNECSNYNDVNAVLTPAGLRALERRGIHTLSIYLKVDRRSRLIKILNRGDDIEESYRRNLSDVGQFDGVEDEVDYVIDNTGYKKGVYELLHEVFKILEENE
jgi:guanylate kinase